MAALLMILKNLKKYTKLQLELLLIFPFLHLENTFIQKQVGKLTKQTLCTKLYDVQNLHWWCPTLLHYENVSSYNTRNKNNYYILTYKLELCIKISFVSDSIRLWNLLKAEARETISINSFRKNISVEIANSRSYFTFGKRFINIIHTNLM